MFIWKTRKGNKIKLLKIGMTNCYLIEYEGINLLIDTGMKRFSEKLLFKLNSLLINSSKLDYLLLTHTHYDHVQNAKLIQKEFTSKVIVHKNESVFLQQGFTRFPKGTNWITKFISNSGNRYAPSFGKYDAIAADILIDDEYNIDQNAGLKIIHTPGHSMGSMSILVENEIAIVGDTLFGAFNNSVLPPFADNREDLFNSWNKLLNTSCDLFLPGHGKAIKRNLLEKEYFKMFSV